MKKINIIYWISTIIASGLMLFSSIPGALLTEDSRKFMGDFMHLPDYFIQFISIAKILGVIAILMPKFNRLKEWAYAGLTFDVVGAIYSIIASDHPLTHIIFPSIVLLLLMGSYLLYHKNLKVNVI